MIGLSVVLLTITVRKTTPVATSKIVVEFQNQVLMFENNES